MSGEENEAHIKKAKAILALILKEINRIERGVSEGVRKSIPKMECKKRLILSCWNHSRHFEVNPQDTCMSYAAFEINSPTISTL